MLPRFHSLSLFAAFALAAAPLAVHADPVTAGPITFGANSPFGEGNFVSTGNGYVIPLTGPAVSLSSLPGADASQTGSLTFSFSLAPGWQIQSILFGDHIDYSSLTPQDNNPANWGVAFAQRLTLCTTGGICSTGQTGDHAGGVPLPPQSFGDDITAGTGTYQFSTFAHNAQFQSADYDSNVEIFVAPSTTFLTPEPSTFFLIGTGFFGLLGLASRKNKMQ